MSFRRLLTVFALVLVIFASQGFAGQSDEKFSLIIIPDTQYLSHGFPEIYQSMTEWIVKNKEKLNIDIHAWINEAIEDKLIHDPASFLIKSIPNGTI